MTQVTCMLSARNWDQLRNHTLDNRVWATFFGHGDCLIAVAGELAATSAGADVDQRARVTAAVTSRRRRPARLRSVFDRAAGGARRAGGGGGGADGGQPRRAPAAAVVPGRASAGRRRAAAPRPRRRRRRARPQRQRKTHLRQVTSAPAAWPV